MGALYQALENTILTPSALLKHDSKTMREAIANEIGLTDINLIYDEPLLDLYYQGIKYLLDIPRNEFSYFISHV